jgi:hypothetical protein
VDNEPPGNVCMRKTKQSKPYNEGRVVSPPTICPFLAFHCKLLFVSVGQRRRLPIVAHRYDPTQEGYSKQATITQNGAFEVELPYFAQS